MKKINKLEMEGFGRKQFGIILFITLLLMFTILIKPGYTGYTIKEIELEFNESGKYDLNETNIISLKLTGMQKGEGEVEIYLGDYKILNSTIIKNISKNTLNSNESYLFEDLGIENISSTNNTLRVILNNASLILMKIDYELDNLLENDTLVESKENNISNKKEIILEQGYAEIGKLVKWKKIVKSDNLTDLTITIPTDAVLIDAKDREGNLIKLEPSSKEEFNVKEITDKEFFINNSDYIEIEYNTEAPESKEEIIDGKKKISIYSEYKYTNVTAYTNIPDIAKEFIKLYHLTESGKEEVSFEGIDENNNSLIDKIKWVVPHLSNQTYEIDLVVLNVQSYPIVGSNWTVSFNTLGKANLTVEAINGTEFGKDLEFISLKCGEIILTESLIDGKVFIENYECNETGYEESKVLSSGKHTLKFIFGEDTEYAYNDALVSPGLAYSWGYNGYGGLGIGNTSNKYEPMTVLYGLNFTTIECGESYNCGLVSNKSAYCWGWNGNNYGNLGIGNVSHKYQPIAVLYGLNFTTISTSLHTCGLVLNGSAYCWGFGLYGQLGIGNTSYKYTVSNPVLYNLNFTTISAGGYHTCGLVLNGSAYCWGRNIYGQLGVGNTSDKYTVSNPVLYNLNFTTISTRANGNTCGLVLNGSAYCWGENTYGELGIGNTSNKYQPIAVLYGLNFTTISANEYTCGLVLNGSAYCWGYNDFGGLGIGNTSQKNEPIAVLNSLNFSMISTGTAHSVGILNKNNPPVINTLYITSNNSYNNTNADWTGVWASTDEEGNRLWNTTWFNTTGKETLLVYDFNVEGATDLSGHGNNGAINDSLYWDATGGRDGSGAYQFNGSKGNIFIENSAGEVWNGASNFTIMVWFKVLGANGTESYLISHDASGVLENRTYLMISGSGDELIMRRGTIQTNSSTISLNEWYLATMVSNTTTFQSYLNGQLWNTSDYDFTTGLINDWYIGTINTTNYFNGSIDEIIIYNYTLSAQQILNIYNNVSNVLDSAETGIYEEWTFNVVASDGYDYGDKGKFDFGVETTGSAYCWGYNDFGQLGIGNTSQKNEPIAVAYGLNFTTIKVGYEYTCDIVINGSAYCLGRNDFGKLGIGNTSNKYTVSDPVLYGLNFTTISAGTSHTCGLVLNGSAYCWGTNDDGTLGIGNSSEKYGPIAVAYGLNFTTISAGNSNTCGTAINGSAYCWGYNDFGQLGIGNTSQKNEPIAVAYGLNFTTISSEVLHTCGLVLNGSAYCWGNNGYGKLGIGNTSNKYTVSDPVLYGLNFTSIDTEGGHNCGTALNGSAYCWGYNNHGQLGIGNTSQKNEPIAVAYGLNFTTISAGGSYSCGLVLNGSAYCWGLNSVGELGIGNTSDKYEPIAVLYGLNFSSIEAGEYDTCGILQSDTFPAYSNINVNNTSPLILENVMFSSSWGDDTGLSKFIFGWNASGALCNTWANDTETAFDNNYQNTTKTIPATCLGLIDNIAWRVYANDTSGNWNSTPETMSFDVLFQGYITDLNSESVEVNFTTYALGTDSQIKNFSTNGSGYYSVEHGKRDYRMILSFLNYTADLDIVNLDRAQTDFIDMDRLSKTDLDITNAITGFAVWSENGTMNSTGNLTFYYNEALLSHSEDYLTIFRCEDYVYQNRSCSGNWLVETTETLNKVNNSLTVNITSFANNITAYAVAENVPEPEPDLVTDSNLTTSVNHSTTANVTLSLSSEGTGAVKNIVFSCVSGDACGNLTISSSNIETINIGGVYNAPIQIITPAGQNPMTYTGVLRLTTDNEIVDVNLFITVNNDTNWNVTPTNLSITTGSFETVSLDTLTLNNSGNNLLGFNLSSNESLSYSQNNFKVEKQTNDTVILNFTGTQGIEVYERMINITSNYSSQTVNFTVNISRIINITGINPSIGLDSSEQININVTANYNGIEIISNMTFVATIANLSCTNLTSSNTSGVWQITCITPDSITDLNRTLKVRGYFSDYDNYASDQEVVSYGDIFPPYVIWQTPNVENSSNKVIINITITEESNLSSGTATITSPTGVVTIVNLELIKENNYIINTTLNEIGDYQINYTLTDNSANLNVGSNATYFEIFTNLTFYGDVLKANGSGSFVQFKLYRQNTTTVLNRFNTSVTDGSYNETIHNRTYDLEMLYGNFTVTLEDIVLGKIGNDPIDIDDIDLKRVGVNNSRDISGLSVNGTLKGTGSMKVDYEQSIVDDIYSVNLYRCEDWNFSQSTCEGNWAGLDTVRGIGYVTADIENFSGYLLSETTLTPSATATGGGGSAAAAGGGGGGVKLAEKLQNLLVEALKASLSVAGIKISTTSIYKELYPGESTIAYVSMQNSLSSSAGLETSVEGDVAKFIKIREANVQLNPSESKTAILDIVVPTGTTAGLYEGNVILSSQGVTVGIPTTIRVLKPAEKLLDLKIYPLQSTIAPGKELNIQTELYNLGQAKTVDVNLYLQLVNPETEELLVVKEEPLVVQNSINTVKKLLIPENIKDGKYLIKAIAFYEVSGNKLQSIALAYIEIKESLFDYKLLGITLRTWMGLIIVVVLSWGIYIYYSYKMAQRKRYLIKVDYRTLPQPGPKSAFVGKIAETGIRTFVNIDTLQTHTLIAGATGGGKSITAMSIVEEALNKNIPVIVFDPTAQWTGFLRKCEDKAMLRRYKYFEMNENLAKGFNGSIHTIKDPREVIDIKDKMNPGEITIFNIGRLNPEQIDTIVTSTIQQVFDASLPESKELKLLIVYDEVHRLLPKFGGSGNGFIEIERGCREFRKWGVGLVLISQVLSDFIGEIKANIGTEIQLRTRYEGDLDRIKMKYGEDLATSIVKAAIGTGMFVNSEYNHGKPYFISFRPLLHNTARLDDKELDIYEKYSTRTDEINYQLKQLKEEHNLDIFDLELELKLAKDKIKKGQFNMADIYLEALEPKVVATWKKIGKVPKQRAYKVISEAEMVKGIEEAKIERKKFILEQEKKKPLKEGVSTILTIEEEYNKLKDLVEQAKNKNIDTSMQEIKLRELYSDIQTASSSKDQKEIDKVQRKIEGIKNELNGQIGPKEITKEEIRKKAKETLQIAESAEEEVRKLLKKGDRKGIEKARELAKKARLKAKEYINQVEGK